MTTLVLKYAYKNLYRTSPATESNIQIHHCIGQLVPRNWVHCDNVISCFIHIDLGSRDTCRSFCSFIQSLSTGPVAACAEHIVNSCPLGVAVVTEIQVIVSGIEYGDHSTTTTNIIRSKHRSHVNGRRKAQQLNILTTRRRTAAAQLLTLFPEYLSWRIIK